MIKVLYVIDSLNGSGAERSLVQIALNFKNIQSVFVHLYKGDMLKKELQSNGIKVHSLNLSKNSGFRETKKKLTTIYKTEKPDIVHSTLFRSDMVARSLKKEFPNIKLVGSFVSNPYKEGRYKGKSLFMRLKLWRAFLRDKSSIKHVDHVISNSETIKIAQCEKLNFPLDKVSVIYRGRDIYKFSKVKLETLRTFAKSLGLENKIVLLNVSRLIPVKGQLDLIKVLPEILKIYPTCVLVIAGHGTYKTILESKIRDLNLEKNVVFLGRFKEIPKLLNIADVFLYPSYSEGLPGALIEAMLTSKIIINSDISENIECVGSSSSITYKVGDLEELKDSILEVLASKESYHSFGMRARNLAVAKFSINKISQEYEKMYETICLKK